VNLAAPPSDKKVNAGTGKGRVMNNTSLTSADSATHLKVVVVSLLAAILVVGVGILAKPNFSDGTATFAQRFDASGPVIRAGKPTTIAGEAQNIR
jgi:hypothetical protein